MDLRTDFLHQIPVAPLVPERPINVFEILREGHLETRVDMVLKFLMDPEEVHGMGTLVLDAFLELIDGAPFIDANGTRTEHFDATTAMGASGWKLGTQVQYIDLYVTNEELNLAVIVENKIGHVFNNPIDNYVRRALSEEYEDIVLVVLAPEYRQHEDPKLNNWVSKSITYAELVGKIRAAEGLTQMAMAPVDINQRRSLELLQQFMEVRTKGTEMRNLSDDDRLVTEWRAFNRDNEAEIEAFFQRQQQAEAIIKRRLTDLVDPIAEELRIRGKTVEVPSRPGRTGDDFWLYFELPEEGWVVELKSSLNFANPMAYVYVHPIGKTTEKTETLTSSLFADDETVSISFVSQALAMLHSE
ncbi:hypothetical protein FYJ24_00530 [Actinomycetaceae bacterium WB03_NA08]|uniref:PD-(D/E)XK nuclease superfamily protein n=1 Tax=Scrofimicrobium canadense TaxID=2652290 RepID=A0A6N7W1V5_9ACTO|nr:PD-(D/E)XK nuclease family protein [Scrofimicrobium canadense]MSS83275.1 hypothetical protein [Scrofimicrobium canadense]